MAMPPAPVSPVPMMAPESGDRPGRSFSPTGFGSPPRLISAGSPPGSPGPEPAIRPQLTTHGLHPDALDPDLPALSQTQTQALAQTLPTELLHRIFLYLPVPVHGQCALVCRHWYACLPDSRTRAIASWVVRCSPRLQAAGAALVPGYGCRTQPFLQGSGCEPLPAPHTAHCFPGLLHYSLLQQKCQAAQLALEPAAIDWNATIRHASHLFSPCSRWLAAKCSGPKTKSKPFLKIYGWHNNRWQEEALSQPSKYPPAAYCFSYKPAATMISCHSWKVLAWQRTLDKPCWNRTLVYRSQELYVPCSLVTTLDGDLIVYCRHIHGQPECQLSFFSYQQGEQGWRKLQTLSYRSFPQWGCMYELGVILGLSTPSPEPGFYQNVMHVWKKNSDNPKAPFWSCRMFPLHIYHTTFRWVSTSPDGRHLVILFESGRICLLGIDEKSPVPEEHYIDCASNLRGRPIHCFRDDSRQLVVPFHRDSFMLLSKNQDGHWANEQLMAILPVADDLSHSPLQDMHMSVDGRTLMRLCTGQIDIFRKDNTDCWQRVTRRQIVASHDPKPLGKFLPPEQMLCATVSGAEGDLWIHGPDSNGDWVKKASFRVGRPVVVMNPSPDGLSLLLTCKEAHPIMLQLSTVPDDEGALSLQPQEGQQEPGL